MNEENMQVSVEKEIETQKMIIAECVPDSVSRKIHIISARIIKGDNGQELNIESQDSPQPTSKTPLDGIATTKSIPQNQDLSIEKTTITKHPACFLRFFPLFAAPR